MQGGMHNARMDSLCSLGRDILKDTCKLGKIAFVHREPGILWFKIKSKACWNNCTPRKGQTWRDVGSQFLTVLRWRAQEPGHMTASLSIHASPKAERAVRKKWTAEEFQSAWEHIWPQQCSKKEKLKQQPCIRKSLSTSKGWTVPGMLSSMRPSFQGQDGWTQAKR